MCESFVCTYWKAIVLKLDSSCSKKKNPIQLYNSNQIKSMISICFRTHFKHPVEYKNLNVPRTISHLPTQCCWSSSDPGCSFWRQRTDWTRRPAGSSHRCGAHIHNHCGTKHIHTSADRYQHVKKNILSSRALTSLPYLSLYYCGAGPCLEQTHRYYVSIKAVVDQCVTAEWGGVWKQTAQGRLTPVQRDWLTDWLTLTCLLGFPISTNEFRPTQRGKQMPDLIMGMTLINQLISNPKK